MHNAAEQILYLPRFASPPFSAQVSVRYMKFTLSSQNGQNYQLASLFDLSVSEKEVKRWMHNEAERMLYIGLLVMVMVHVA